MITDNKDNSSEDNNTEQQENVDVNNDEIELLIENDISESDIEEIVTKIETIDDVKAERDIINDRLMRSLADAENLRKRTERDRRDTETYAVTKISRDLLSVYDNLQRALDLADEKLDENALPIIEGVELTQRELLNVFTKHRIKQVEPVIGEKFDPKLHQAMFEAPTKDIEKGAIFQVMTVGFVIGDRLLRAAQVGVSSGAILNEEREGDDQ